MARMIQVGEKAQSIGIQRANVAKGFPGRAVPVDPNKVIVKTQVFADNVKKNVEVSQKDVIKYKFNRVPSNYYYFLIARLNTDMGGNVIGDQFQVEYIRMAERQYDEFTKAVREMGTYVSIYLEIDESGKFSFLKATPSNYSEIPQTVFAKLEQMRQTEGVVDSLYGIVDASTTITIEKYQEMLNDEMGVQVTGPYVANLPPASAPIPAPQIPAPQIPAPQIPAPQIPAVPEPAPQVTTAPVTASPPPTPTAADVIQDAPSIDAEYESLLDNELAGGDFELAED